MKRYSYFHALILSFFSKSLYQDIARNWRGTGLPYLLVVLALVWIPTVIKGHVDLAGFVNNEAPAVTQQIPVIRIKNGKASTDVPTPYSIKLPKTGETLMLIDTSDNSDSINSSVPVILKETKLIMSQPGKETKVYDLSSVGNFTVDRPKVEGWLATAKHWFFPVLYPFAVLFSFIFRAIQVLIYAAIGILFSRMLNAKLDYKTLMRLAAVAITPVLILDLILEFVKVQIPLFVLLGIVIELGYLFFAVKVNVDNEEIPHYQPPAPYPGDLS